MKKLLTILLTICLIVPIFGTFKVYADGAYEVAYINDDGSFSSVSTYSDFDSAKAKMKENDDYVVRHANSKSPSKIIAMNSGLVYSYPYRRGSSTINIYSSINSSLVGSGVSTYVAEHYEMTYHSTYYYYEAKGYGYVEVTLNGFRGYTDLEYTDLVPTKFIEKGIQITLGGGDITGSGEEAFKVIPVQNYYYVKESNGYRDLVFNYHRAWSKNGSEALSYESTIGVAPDFMKTGKKYYSNDGVNFYSDKKLNDYVGTYYNYYQFLPLRSYTKISANTMNAYLNEHAGSNSIILGKGQDFIDAQNEYGCNGATILCMAIHESAWGTSNIARGKNNLFGWGAFDDKTSNATTYSSVLECVKCQMADNLANYLDVKCSRYFSMSLGNKGGGFVTKYASDPYWAEKISSFYYSLDKYDNSNGELTDYGSYNLALVNKQNAEVKENASASSDTLYQTANKSGYQKNLIVINLGVEGSYTKTQLSNPKYGEVVYPITLAAGTLVTYDKDKSVGYIANENLVSINYDGSIGNVINNKEKDAEPIDTTNMSGLASVSKFELNGSNVYVKGTALIEKVDFKDETSVLHQLVLKDINDENKSYSFDLNSYDASINLGDGYSYKYVGYEGNVDVSNIDLSSYTVAIRVKSGAYTKDINLVSSNNKFYNLVSNVNDATLRLTSNALYGYRLELELFSTPLNYSEINKPEMNRPSMFTYLSNSIDDDLNIKIEANAMIYYLDYANKDNINYEVYLIKNKNDYLKLDTSIIDSPYNYNELLNSDYDMTYICFKAEGNISNLSGDYQMVVKITNNSNGTSYVDYINMSKSSDSGLASVSKNNLTYSIIKLDKLDKTILSVK